MKSVKPLDYIADYYGEKFAFYFAFLLHYTMCLIPPAGLGMLIYAVQLLDWQLSKDKDYNDAMDSVFNCLYSIVIALWTTWFVESWKRKENWLSNRWLVRDFAQTSFDRRKFQASLNVDSELRHAWKVVKPNYTYYLLSIPVSLIFMVLVIGLYIGIQFWQNNFIEKYVTQIKPVVETGNSTNSTDA